METDFLSKIKFTRKKSNPNRKIGKEAKQAIYKMKPKTLINTKRCSNSFVNREMKIKPQDVNLHLATVRKIDNGTGWGGCGGRATLVLGWWRVDWCSTSGEQPITAQAQ